MFLGHQECRSTGPKNQPFTEAVTKGFCRPCRATHLAIGAWMLFSRETVLQSLQAWTIH